MVAIVFIVAAVLGGGGGSKDTSSAARAGPAPTPAPAAEERQDRRSAAAQTAEELGYPSFATGNTTRVGGSDAATNAAAVALAVFPSTTAAQRPAAVDPGRRRRLAGSDRRRGADGGPGPGATAPLRPRRPARPDRRGPRRARPPGRQRHRRTPRLRDRRRRRAGRTARRPGSRAANAGRQRPPRSRRCATELFGSAPDHIVVAPSEDGPNSRRRPRPGPPAPATRSSTPNGDKLPEATAAALKRHDEGARSTSSDRPRRSPPTVVREIAKIGAERPARLRRGPGRQRDRLRPLRRRRLRLERQRPRPRLRPRPQRRAARRRRRGAALGLGYLGPAAAHRQRRYAADGTARILPRREARLHHQSDPRLLQPRLGDRRPGGHRREPAGRSRTSSPSWPRSAAKNERGREPASCSAQAHEVTAEDIRALAGASTPHFALQVRNRIRRLIEPLPGRAPGPARRRAQDRRARRSRRAQRRPARHPGRSAH